MYVYIFYLPLLWPCSCSYTMIWYRWHIAHQISMYLAKAMAGNDLTLKFWFHYKRFHYIIIIKIIPAICLKNVMFHAHYYLAWVYLYYYIWWFGNNLIRPDLKLLGWDDLEIIWSCVSMQGNIISVFDLATVSLHVILLSAQYQNP